MGDLTLSAKQYVRYSRQIMLTDWGEAGQLRLSQSKVLIVGCGGLGNGAASYLAGAGVGHLVLVDDDEVALSNLPRQLAFDEDSLENAKAFALANRLREQNPQIKVEPHVQRFGADNSASLLRGCDLVIDCSDNFATRYLLNARCVESNIALLSGSVIGWQGQLLLVDPQQPEAGCYQCLFSAADDKSGSCASMGVSGPVVGMVSSLQANQALRYLLALPSALGQSLCLVDGASLNQQLLTRRRRSDCPACQPSTRGTSHATN